MESERQIIASQLSLLSYLPALHLGALFKEMQNTSSLGNDTIIDMARRG